MIDDNVETAARSPFSCSIRTRTPITEMYRNLQGEPKLLLGLEYALIRPEIARLADEQTPTCCQAPCSSRWAAATHSDSPLRSWRPSPRTTDRVLVAFGPAHPSREAVMERLAGLPNVHRHRTRRVRQGPRHLSGRRARRRLEPLGGRLPRHPDDRHRRRRQPATWRHRCAAERSGGGHRATRPAPQSSGSLRRVAVEVDAARAAHGHSDDVVDGHGATAPEWHSCPKSSQMTPMSDFDSWRTTLPGTTS